MHLQVTVMLSARIKEHNIIERVEQALAPYDRDAPPGRYLLRTRAEVIAHERRDRERLRDSDHYKEFLADPAAYRAKHSDNPWHVDYLEHEAPKLFAMSDDQLWYHASLSQEEFMIDRNGDFYSRHNPRGYWDLWLIGGKWNGAFHLKPGAEPCEPVESQVRKDIGDSHVLHRSNDDPRRVNCARIRDMPAESIPAPTEHIGLDGTWRLRGPDGWRDATDEDDKRYEEQFFADIAAAPRGTWLVNIDCKYSKIQLA